MEKPKLIPQIYGYAVCLVAVITFLICITTLVNSLIDMGDPLHAGGSYSSDRSLASYDIYKMETLKSTKTSSEQGKSDYTPDEKMLRSMYDAAKNEKITSEMHNIRRTMIVDTLLIIVCAIFFITHWRWMKKL